MRDMAREKKKGSKEEVSKEGRKEGRQITIGSSISKLTSPHAIHLSNLFFDFQRKNIKSGGKGMQKGNCLQ